jgi:hypothetical protein
MVGPTRGTVKRGAPHCVNEQIGSGDAGVFGLKGLSAFKDRQRRGCLSLTKAQGYVIEIWSNMRAFGFVNNLIDCHVNGSVVRVIVEQGTYLWFCGVRCLKTQKRADQKQECLFSLRRLREREIDDQVKTRRLELLPENTQLGKGKKLRGVPRSVAWQGLAVMSSPGHSDAERELIRICQVIGLIPCRRKRG